MKLSIIASVVSGAGIVAAAAVAAPSSATCVAYDGVCFLNGVDYGSCCDDGICAGSRCRDPKTLTPAEPTPTAEPSCVPYDGVCFQGGIDYGACCDDGICAGSRCRDPKTLGAEPTA